ncbi:hypothetical protein GGX14DRAFT_554218 [Mycena pura]|uniref:Uncharacterized protein n=1 Tax=Mycena pura TaxID=153505 RepID=A0AAD6YW23_9AGAR|nr:hypothetical protein GGX14DRAFT_554218 [Mycena pura]
MPTRPAPPVRVGCPPRAVRAVRRARAHCPPQAARALAVHRARGPVRCVRVRGRAVHDRAPWPGALFAACNTRSPRTAHGQAARIRAGARSRMHSARARCARPVPHAQRTRALRPAGPARAVPAAAGATQALAAPTVPARTPAPPACCTRSLAVARPPCPLPPAPRTRCARCARARSRCARPPPSPAHRARCRMRWPGACCAQLVPRAPAPCTRSLRTPCPHPAACARLPSRVLAPAGPAPAPAVRCARPPSLVRHRSPAVPAAACTAHARAAPGRSRAHLRRALAAPAVHALPLRPPAAHALHALARSLAHCACARPVPRPPACAAHALAAPASPAPAVPAPGPTACARCLAAGTRTCYAVHFRDPPLPALQRPCHARAPARNSTRPVPASTCTPHACARTPCIDTHPYAPTCPSVHVRTRTHARPRLAPGPCTCAPARPASHLHCHARARLAPDLPNPSRACARVRARAVPGYACPALPPLHAPTPALAAPATPAAPVPAPTPAYLLCPLRPRPHTRFTPPPQIHVRPSLRPLAPCTRARARRHTRSHPRACVRVRAHTPCPVPVPTPAYAPALGACRTGPAHATVPVRVHAVPAPTHLPPRALPPLCMRPGMRMRRAHARPYAGAMTVFIVKKYVLIDEV